MNKEPTNTTHPSSDDNHSHPSHSSIRTHQNPHPGNSDNSKNYGPNRKKEQSGGSTTPGSYKTLENLIAKQG